MSEVPLQFSTLMHRATALWRARLDERLRPWGMSYTTWLTLRILRNESGIGNQRALAARLGIETPTLVRILDRMETLGTLRRTATPDDRRQKRIEITAQGRRLLARIDREVVALRRQMLDGIAPAELEAGIALFERILANGAARPAR